MYDNLLANVPTDLWIGGKWRKSSDGQRFDVIDPATGEVVARVPSFGTAEVRTAIEVAKMSAAIAAPPVTTMMYVASFAAWITPL